MQKTPILSLLSVALGITMVRGLSSLVLVSQEPSSKLFPKKAGRKRI